MKVKLIIVAAPSGAGKSTLMARAVSEIPELVDIFSYTTRPPRPGETNGNPYFFVSEEDFTKKREEGFFAEWANVHGNFYGTSRQQIEEWSARGKWIIMDVDVKGATSLKRLYPESVSIFILPPSVEELKKRLALRDAGKTQNYELRLANAIDEILSAPKFDYQLVNDDFERSYLQFKKIIEDTIKKS